MLTRKDFLLDTNIVIKIWNHHPDLFGALEKSHVIDFWIYHGTALELSKKESTEIDGVQVLTDKFMKLLAHIINDDIVGSTEIHTPNIPVKYDANKQIYYINKNKLSTIDYKLICICKNNKYYTLVTDDKRMFKAAKGILPPSSVLTFSEFLNDIMELDF